MYWGGTRTVKAELIPGAELRYPALAGFSDIQDLLGLGLLLAPLGSWPILAHTGSSPTRTGSAHPFLVSVTPLSRLRKCSIFHFLFLFGQCQRLWFL